MFIQVNGLGNGMHAKVIRQGAGGGADQKRQRTDLLSHSVSRRTTLKSAKVEKRFSSIRATPTLTHYTRHSTYPALHTSPNHTQFNIMATTGESVTGVVAGAP